MAKKKSPNTTKQLSESDISGKFASENKKNAPIRFFLSPGFC